MTYNPPWLPSWPSGIQDPEAIYEQTIPQQLPRGLRFPETDTEKDWQVAGVVFSWVDKALEWVRMKYFPQHDSDALFLDLWERQLNLQPSSSTATRIARIVAAMRNRGTATVDVLKAIFAPAFGTDDPSKLGIVRARAEDLLAGGATLQEHFQVGLWTTHVHGDGVLVLDRDMADSFAMKAHRLGTQLTVGRHRHLMYDDADAGYERGVYDDPDGGGVPEYRDGDVPWTAVASDTIAPDLENGQMQQLAGALQALWVPLFDWSQDTAAAWSYVDNINRGDATLIRGWYASPGASQKLYIEFGEHLHLRHGCILDAIRIKTGGSTNDGSGNLKKEKSFTSGTNYPDAPVQELTLFDAGDDVFQGPHLTEATGINRVLDQDYRYFIEINSPAGPCYVAGVAVRVLPPIEPYS